MATQHRGFTMPQLSILRGYVFKISIPRLTFHEWSLLGGLQVTGVMPMKKTVPSPPPVSLSFPSLFLHCDNLDLKGSQISCVEGLLTGWWRYGKVTGPAESKPHRQTRG